MSKKARISLFLHIANRRAVGPDTVVNFAKEKRKRQNDESDINDVASGDVASRTRSRLRLRDRSVESSYTY